MALLRLLAAAAMLAALAGCAQAPPPTLPAVPVATVYKEPVAPAASAAPDLQADGWWTLFGDAELNALQQRLQQNSPDLAAAVARWQQAQATNAQLRAAQGPSVSGALNVQTLRQSEKRPLRVLGPNSPDRYDSATLGLDLQYEIDFWGRVRSQVALGAAQDQAAQADLAFARLALQAQLADSYLALRGLDRDAMLLREAEASLARALDLVVQRHGAGIASGLDVARAQAQLEATRSQVRQSSAQRALLEHAIATLVGAAAPDFAIAPRSAEIALPAVPAGVPSTLLQRRPDIAAAERRVAAANASVGVARAAFFPTVTLGASGGLQTSDFSNFLRAPNLFWAVGPAVALSLFDGGRRQAEATRVQAVLDEAGERYRGVVLAAFQQVEDSLALLAQFSAAAEAERAAMAAAQRSLDLATTRYREGAASYLEVVAAQTTTLQAQRSAQDLATRQRRASVQLVRALGGGWRAKAGAALP